MIFLTHCVDVFGRNISSLSADSWFVGASYCLCIACNKGNWKQFHKIFSCVGDITEDTVVIKLWRFGEWREIKVETTLPREGVKNSVMSSHETKVYFGLPCFNRLLPRKSCSCVNT